MQEANLGMSDQSFEFVGHYPGALAPEEVPFSQVSYTALKAMFGVLYGSI